LLIEALFVDLQKRFSPSRSAARFFNEDSFWLFFDSVGRESVCVKVTVADLVVMLGYLVDIGGTRS